MAITRAKKESLLKETTEALAKAVSVAFVAFRGMTVKEINEVRAALKQEGVAYKVVKKTLLKRALVEKKITGEMPDLVGEVAYVYLPETSADANVPDITAPARSLQAFVKKSKGKLAFLGGVLEGKYLSQSEIVSVATIPPMPVLRGMFVNIVNSPIQRMAIALGQIAEKKA